MNRRRPKLPIPPAAMELATKGVAVVALALFATLGPVVTVAHADAGASAQGAGGTALALATPQLKFGYSWPAAANRIPALAAWLRADATATRAHDTRNAVSDTAGPRAAGQAPMPDEGQTTWQVVTDLPGWLSLSANTYRFYGGAHGNPGFRTLLWDKVAGLRRAPLDLFASPAALSAAIRPAFCAEIDRQRAHKRGASLGAGHNAMFEDCIDPVKETVILGSAGHRGFDRIGVLVAPYEAGPYAEGEYEVTLAVTPAIRAAVKPQFRAAFVVSTGHTAFAPDGHANGSQKPRAGAI